MPTMSTISSRALNVTNVYGIRFYSSRLESLRELLVKEGAGTPKNKPKQTENIPLKKAEEANKTFAIETYGCQMNVSDSEVVRSILLQDGWSEVDALPRDIISRAKKSESIIMPDLTLINTCAIRDNAENKIWYLLFCSTSFSSFLFLFLIVTCLSFS